MSLHLSIIPPPRQSMQMHARNPDFLAPPSPRSPDGLLPSNHDLPLTPRTKRRTFDAFGSAIDIRIQAASSPYDKIRLTINKWELSCCEPCIVKRVASHAPTCENWCCCKVENVPLMKLGGSIKSAENCSKCLAAIPCCLLCLCTLGCSLRKETFCCPEQAAKVSPI